jgi:DNA-binding transcriptional LysR family regulator
MSKLERIHTFINVTEQNSFVAAAKKLGVSPATVTRQISLLEEELGVQLIRRTTRSLHLTAIGQRYYQEAKKLIEQFVDTERLIAQSQDEPSGKLKILATRFFLESVVIPHLAEFQELYPNVNIYLEWAERFPNFDKEGVDVFFGTALEGPADLVRKRILTSAFIFCASPQYLAKFGTPKKPEDINRHHYIAHLGRTNPDMVDFHGHPSICVKPALWVNDLRAMIAAATSGIGIIKAHSHVVSQYLEAKRLVEVYPEYRDPDYPAYLYYQPNRYLEPKIRKFIDFYLDKLKQMFKGKEIG